MSLCPCTSGQSYEACCAPWHQGTPAPTAQALMRSRYCAYTQANIEYLVKTTLPIQQQGLDQEAMRAWSQQSQWLGLEVLTVEELANDPIHAYVSFNAHWQDTSGKHTQFERSAFVKNGESWYFIDPTVSLNASRNDPCPCQSGRKFKKCCSDFIR